MWVRGNELPEVLRSQVLNRYPYRMTEESAKRWPETTKRMVRGGYSLPLISDVEWLRISEFDVTARGELSRRTTHCLCYRTTAPN